MKWPNGLSLAYKYYGYCTASTRIHGELQIVPMLIGLYWEVEHSTLYKPSPQLKGAMRSLKMQQRDRDVLNALKAFDEDFERLLQGDPLRQSSKNHIS